MRIGGPLERRWNFFVCRVNVDFYNERGVYGQLYFIKSGTVVFLPLQTFPEPWHPFFENCSLFLISLKLDGMLWLF